MALREGSWRGHTQWICDEHDFDTVVEATARDHVAEYHADETLPGAAAAVADQAPASDEKKGK